MANNGMTYQDGRSEDGHSEDGRGEDGALPAPMLDAAADWHACLREPEPDAGLAVARKADFDRWIAADPRHARAYARIERLWVKLEAPVAEIMRSDPAAAVTNGQRRHWLATLLPRPAWAAASLAFLLLVGAFQIDDVVTSLRSDHRTVVGERASLELDDGSRVTLNTDSAITAEMNPERRQVDLLRGEAWFDVAADSDRPFVVATEVGRIRVTGTSFGVRLDDDAAVVALTKGELDLRIGDGPDDTAPALMLTAGHQARLSHDGAFGPTALNNAAATAWLRGQIVFFDTPLPDVVAELNRYRAGRILILDGDLDGLTVSGVFPANNPNAGLDAIASTLPVRVTRLTDLLVILR